MPCYVHDCVQRGVPHMLLGILAAPDGPRDPFGMIKRADWLSPPVNWSQVVALVIFLA